MRSILLLENNVTSTTVHQAVRICWYVLSNTMECFNQGSEPKKNNGFDFCFGFGFSRILEVFWFRWRENNFGFGIEKVVFRRQNNGNGNSFGDSCGSPERNKSVPKRNKPAPKRNEPAPERNEPAPDKNRNPLIFLVSV